MAGKRIYGIIAGIAFTGLLAGCGDNSVWGSDYEYIVPEYVDITLAPVAAGPVANPGAPAEEKLVYHTGKLTQEEENAILDQMKTLKQNLEVQEYVGEGLHMVSCEEWFEIMAPRLYEGGRAYTLQKGEETLLTVLVAYNISGELYSNVFFNDAEDKVAVLRQEGDVTQLVQSQVNGEGQYDGSYEMWQINGATGEIRTEKGTYANGTLVGEYTVAVCSAPPGSVFDLWSNREGFVYETSTIIYDQPDEAGPTGDPQPGSVQTPEPSQTPAVTQTPSATPKPAATPKPVATQKPAVTQKPAETPEPQEPEPQEPEPQEPQPQEPQPQEPEPQTPEPQTPVPTPEPQTPAPTPEPQTPAPTPEPQTPAPTPEPQTPAPTPEPQTPAPTPEPQTPAPTPEPQTPAPTPEPQTPAPTQEPTTPPQNTNEGDGSGNTGGDVDIEWSDDIL